jgi:hypothetical protein
VRNLVAFATKQYADGLLEAQARDRPVDQLHRKLEAKFRPEFGWGRIHQPTSLLSNQLGHLRDFGCDWSSRMYPCVNVQEAFESSRNSRSRACRICVFLMFLNNFSTSLTRFPGDSSVLLCHASGSLTVAFFNRTQSRFFKRRRVPRRRISSLVFQFWVPVFCSGDSRLDDLRSRSTRRCAPATLFAFVFPVEKANFCTGTNGKTGSIRLRRGCSLALFSFLHSLIVFHDEAHLSSVFSMLAQRYAFTGTTHARSSEEKRA